MVNLEVMAARLCKSPKTFRKYIHEYKIPHIRLGRSYLFDPGKVELYLESIHREQQKPERENVRKFARPVGKYAGRLGL